VDEKLIDEILDAVLPPIEAAESQTAAVIQLLRERGILNDDDFARFQEQAENASEIRSRAMRLRLKRILSAMSENIEKLRKQVEDLAKEKAAEAGNPEHRDRKEGPPTKEGAVKQDDRPREEMRRQSAEKPQKEEAPAAREDREPQEPQRKAS